MLNEGFEVVIIDYLSNSTIAVLTGIGRITKKTPLFENFDLREKDKVQQLKKKHYDVIRFIHFAASKAVRESIQKPLLYYENNLAPLIYVLQELKEKLVANFIFSFSCTVYDETEPMSIPEMASIQPAVLLYGNTKQIGEEIIKDVAKVSSLNAVLLLYFNPIGSHPSLEIGELPLGVPQNLIPYIM